MLASSKCKYSKTLAFPDTYYELIINVLQSVELFCAYDVLQDKGKVTAAIAKEFAESEFEKYRVIQDSLYESDFDKLMNDMEKNDS